MLDDAVRSGDWPGWDEAWVPIVFPLGIPLAVTVALTLGGAGVRATSARLVTSSRVQSGSGGGDLRRVVHPRRPRA